LNIYYNGELKCKKKTKAGELLESLNKINEDRDDDYKTEIRKLGEARKKAEQEYKEAAKVWNQAQDKINKFMDRYEKSLDVLLEKSSKARRSKE